MKPSVELKAKVNLNLFLKVDVSLLIANAADIEQELDQIEPYLTLITKKLPKWFYWDTPKNFEAPYTEDEIRILISQARLELDGKDFEIAQELLYSVNDRGYLKVDVQEIARALRVDVESVEKVRRFIMRELEPLGVCSKDLFEFLQLQLEELYPKKHSLHKEVIEALKTGRVDSQIKEFLSCFRLSPLSGKVVYRSGPVDVVVEHADGEWVVFIYDDFVDLEIKDHNEEDKSIKKAKNLKFVLQMRRDILRKVTYQVLGVQEDFFLKGYPLKSLTLTEVSNKIGIDVSTLSRIVNNKYIKTPLGIYPLRFFFVRNSLKGLSTEEVTRLVKEAINKLGLEATDKEVSLYLKEMGINLSRRTVNKYRKLI